MYIRLITAVPKARVDNWKKTC